MMLCGDCAYYFNGECTSTTTIEHIGTSATNCACKDFERRDVYKVEDLPENQTLISKSDVVRIIHLFLSSTLSKRITKDILRKIDDLPCFCQDDLKSDTEASSGPSKMRDILDFIAREEFTAVSEPCSSLLDSEEVDVIRTDALRDFINKLLTKETE